MLSIMLKSLKDNAKTVPTTLEYRLRNFDRTLTIEDYKEALSQDGLNLYYVPERTEELCKLAVNSPCKEYSPLCWVPEGLRTEEICKLAVINNEHALLYVPGKLRTEELCKLAVSNHGNALQYVPEGLRTEEMCKLAVSNDPRAIDFVHQEILIRKLLH